MGILIGFVPHLQTFKHKTFSVTIQSLILYMYVPFESSSEQSNNRSLFLVIMVFIPVMIQQMTLILVKWRNFMSLNVWLWTAISDLLVASLFWKKVISNLLVAKFILLLWPLPASSLGPGRCFSQWVCISSIWKQQCYKV